MWRVHDDTYQRIVGSIYRGDDVRARLAGGLRLAGREPAERAELAAALLRGVDVLIARTGGDDELRWLRATVLATPEVNDVLLTMAREVLDGNRYLSLGTAGPDGRPRVSPVFFTHAGHQAFYWVSEPGARHSRNIAGNPAVAAVVFDSTAAVGAGRAVYLDAVAREVPAAELPVECAAAYRTGKDGIAFTPGELSGGQPLRLFRADATAVEVHVPGGHPTLGTGIDRRLPVRVPREAVPDGTASR